MTDIHYSDGSVASNCVVQVWDDFHSECSGRFYRAFWCATPNADSGSPVVGYCSPGGSHRTVRAVVAEVQRLHPGTECYRNGRLIRNN